jgi:hypothetical protein
MSWPDKRRLLVGGSALFLTFASSGSSSEVDSWRNLENEASIEISRFVIWWFRAFVPAGLFFFSSQPGLAMTKIVKRGTILVKRQFLTMNFSIGNFFPNKFFNIIPISYE